MADKSWQDPPTDMLDLIYFRLFPIDRIAFSRACRSWHDYARSRPRPSFPLILPWLYWADNYRHLRSSCRHTSPYYCRLRSSCRLRSPFHANVYLPYQIPEAEPPIDEFISCRGSVGSWLLYFTFNEGDRPFFLDPAFNNRRVHLAPWPGPWRLLLDAIISAAPTERGCTVVFLHGNMLIHCKVGDEMWSISTVDTNLSTTTGAFVNGTLHLIDERQRLGVVDLRNVSNAVTWLAMDVGPLRKRPALSNESQPHFLMESSGTLLLAFVGRLKRWYVFRADLRAMAWRAVEDLQDRSLFIAPGRSVSAVAIEAGVEANRLYFTRGAASEESLQRWISVATHRQDNCWEEISWFWSYPTDPPPPCPLRSPLCAARWVFQPVVVIDGNPGA